MLSQSYLAPRSACLQKSNMFLSGIIPLDEPFLYFLKVFLIGEKKKKIIICQALFL